MYNRIFVKLSQYKEFWFLRNILIRLKFWIDKIFYSLRYRLGDKKENASSLFELVRITYLGLTFSIISLFVLIFVDPYLLGVYTDLGINILHGEEYVSFFVTVSGICGVFIGLYYAAISTVSASVYSQVANNIRALLLREKIGNIYMRFLSFLTFLSLLIVVSRILFNLYINLAVILVILLSGIGIIAFVKLGQRAFYLFDPTSLSNTIFYEMRKYLQMVFVGGYKWSDKNFQSHANKLVSQNIDTVETLSSIVKNSPHLAGQPYFELSKRLLGFLVYYQDNKHQIPTDSNWFDIIYIHKNWYKTDYSSLEIAHRTGTQLYPENERDYFWLENRLLPIVYDCIKVNLEANNRTLAFTLLQYYESFLELLGSNGELSKAVQFMGTLDNSLSESMKSKFSTAKSNKDVLLIVGYYEYFVTIYINSFLAFVKTFETYDRDLIKDNLHNIDWSNIKSLFKNNFPSFCIKHLEWLQKRIVFEINVEGRLITPLWYTSEIMSLHIFNELSNSITVVVKSIFSEIRKIKGKYSEDEFIWTYSALLSREWEFYHKVQRGLNRLEIVLNNLYEKRCIDGLNWNPIEWEKIYSNLEQEKITILEDMSKTSILLSLKEKSKEFPDYEGQFLHTLSESVIDAISLNKIELLNSIFPAFFYVSLSKFDDLKPVLDKIDWRAEQNIKIAFSPLLDLVEISGYAYLMSKVFSNPSFWESIKGLWDKYFAENAEKKLIIFSSAITITESSFEIPHRGVIRTSWRQRIEGVLRTLPRKKIFRKRSMIPIPEEYVDHKSALVRLIGKPDHHSRFTGIDIFTLYYLYPLSSTEEISFGKKYKDLEDSITREEKRYNDAK